MSKKKICLVVQRYGLEVNGGAELQCRQFAEHLLEIYEVHVATTKAIDYMTWKDEYKEDIEDINGVTVRRFSVDCIREKDAFDRINGQFLQYGLNAQEEIEWLEKQGPKSSALLEYLEKSVDEYVAFIFFTYLYYPTVLGLPRVKEKAILVPEAHDEPYMNMNIIQKLFYEPRAFFFNTEEERQFVFDRFHNEGIPSEVGGVGIELPQDISAQRFREKYNLDRYVIYVGRIDEGKNCQQLFDYFIEYKKRNQNNLQLVLIGKPVIPVPCNQDIISLGFVSDEDKFDGICGAEILVLPSRYESLSMVVLEAMSLGTPVIVNGECRVLKGHCIHSNGAFYYNDYFEFEGEINYYFSNMKEKCKMVQNAKLYVEKNYQWDAIVERLVNLIEKIGV